MAPEGPFASLSVHVANSAIWLKLDTNQLIRVYCLLAPVGSPAAWVVFAAFAVAAVAGAEIERVGASD